MLPPSVLLARRGLDFHDRGRPGSRRTRLGSARRRADGALRLENSTLTVLRPAAERRFDNKCKNNT